MNRFSDIDFANPKYPCRKAIYYFIIALFASGQVRPIVISPWESSKNPGLSKKFRRKLSSSSIQRSNHATKQQVHDYFY